MYCSFALSTEEDEEELLRMIDTSYGDLSEDESKKLTKNETR